MTRRIVVMLTVLLLVAAGMGIYAWQLHKKVTAEEQRLAANSRMCAPPANGPTAASNTLPCFGCERDTVQEADQHSFAGGAQRTGACDPACAIRNILAVRLAAPIGAGADIRDVYLLSDGSAVVDTNAAFADAHPSGVLAEELTITSIVATLNANDPKINRVKIIVNGAERDTFAGHADLRRFYLASNMGQLAKELQ